MRGRWAAGIMPRNFCWIIKDHLAVSERPGGYAPNHRKVRRHEELLWLRAQGFTRVVSLLASTHNLHAYDELGLAWSRFPVTAPVEMPAVLSDLYPALYGWLHAGERLLLHQEELGDCVMGVVAGYLLWSEMLPDGPRAITAVEQLLRRQMGAAGRIVVAAVDEVPPLRAMAAAGGGGTAETGEDAPEGPATAEPEPELPEAPGLPEPPAAPTQAAPGEVAGSDGRPGPETDAVGDVPAHEEVAPGPEAVPVDAPPDGGPAVGSAAEAPQESEQSPGHEEAMGRK